MQSLKALIAIALVSTSLHAESPLHHKKEIVVAALHVADAITTHNNLTDPCQCYREADPLAPKSGSWKSQIAFHAALGGVVIYSAHWFKHHGSPRFAKFLLWENITVESFAVANNAAISGRHR
jgi:hypothetical protein